MAYRKEKLEEQIHRLVADLIIKEIKDPRIGFATITGVTLSKDYSLARVGVSVMGGSRDLRKTIEGLNSATGFIQHRVGKALKIRTTPKIHFFLDSSVVEAVEMVNLLETVAGDDTHSHEPGEDAGSDDALPDKGHVAD